jgi:hypothetical protein
MITTLRVVIVCIVAALIGSGLVTAFMRPAKVVAAATPAAELPRAKGVRIVPIYRKIEEQAPQIAPFWRSPRPRRLARP